MLGIPAEIGFLLVTLQPPMRSESVGAAVFSSARLVAATANLVETSSPGKAKKVRARASRRRDMTIAGIALVASGTVMAAVNSAGLASGVTIPPGGERDGYLGKPGVVIGCALVIAGIVVIVRAHAP